MRVYDIPLMAKNEYVGRMIGDSLGHIKEVDLEAGEIGWGEYMRVGVKIDISKPLVLGVCKNFDLENFDHSFQV